MDELDEIKKKKLEALKSQQSDQMQEQQQMQRQIAQLESVVKQALTKEALERYGNLKAAHPDKAVQVLVILAQAIQSGQVSKIEDSMLKEILMKLTPEKKDFKIKRV
jgi:DNA-binding TFAR19-related protein (PDSD5 family)|tara:strand:+ start:344 stop:664 length:321 start_codon:yes stop_codon:yes gene_type:complete